MLCRMLQLLLSLVVFCNVIACGPLVRIGVQVKSKNRPRPEFKPSSQKELDPNAPFDLQEWLADYHRLDKDSEAVLVEKIKAGLRYQVRNSLAALEEAVPQPIDELFEPHSLLAEELTGGKELLTLLMEKQLSPWASLLEGERLLFEDSKWPATGESRILANQLAVGLFFDFGVNVRAEARLSQFQEQKMIASEVNWELIPEHASEASAHHYESPDELPNVRLHLSRQVPSKTDKDPIKDFHLEILLGPGLFLNQLQEHASYHRLLFHYEQNPDQASPASRRFHIWQGHRIGYKSDWTMQRYHILTLSLLTAADLVASDLFNQFSETEPIYELLVESYRADDEHSEQVRYFWSPAAQVLLQN